MFEQNLPDYDCDTLMYIMYYPYIINLYDDHDSRFGLQKPKSEHFIEHIIYYAAADHLKPFR